jgi:hypothetical protein
MRGEAKFDVKLLGIILAAAGTICGATAAEDGNTQSLPPLPPRIVTTDGKTFESVRLVRAEPDGLVIQFAPAARGLGLAKIRFQSLPEDLRQQYGFSADRAKAFEAEQAQTLAQWRSPRPQQESAVRPAASEQNEAEQPAPPAPAPALLDSGRYQVATTIAGAVIIDKRTGQSWLADLHSTITPQDLSAFLQRKDTADR